jgi:single-strand DNA-binding protein
MNKIELEGNLGRDPEMKYLTSGKAVANCTLATSNDYKVKGSSEWVKKPPSWHNIVAFGPDAEALYTYQKGDKLAVEGKLQYDEWEDKQGNKRVTAKIICFGIAPKVGSEKPDTRQADNRGPAPEDDVPF